ncbi:LicD family protein, partial [Pseudarthrobacter sp. NKDBFgelt]
AAAGIFRIGRHRGKLVVAGRVPPTTSEVFISVNDHLIKVVRTAPLSTNPQIYKFWFAFGGSTLKRLPESLVIRVSSAQGMLRANSGAGGIAEPNPRGNGRLFRAIARGWTIDKWGQIALPIAHKAEWKHSALDAYQEFQEYFRKTFNKDLYFVAGTLLGAVREGDFIAHDDDMDVGYFSTKASAEEVRDEMFEILYQLRSDGWPTKIG